MTRWGVIGVGRMAKKFINALEESENGRLYAIASVSKINVQFYSQKYPELVVYDDYITLLEDKMVEAVYIALPHQFHVKYSLEALKRRIPVLCEKPAALTTHDFQRVIDASEEYDTLYIEALKTRFMPAYISLKKEIYLIGDIEFIDCQYGYNGDRVSGYFYDPVDGGIVYDVVCYPVSFILDLVDSNVLNIDASTTIESGVEVEYSATISFHSGAIANIEGHLSEKEHTLAVIEGSKGKIVIPDYSHPTKYVLTLNQTEQVIERTFEEKNELVYEIDAMEMCLVTGLKVHPDMTLEDSMKVISVIENIKKETKSD